MISDAVGSEVISKVTGYKFTQGQFQESTPNLPQRVAILGQGNVANQATMPTVPTEITSAQQAGDLFGYGSPIHIMMRIIRPNVGSGIQGIPTVVYPQLDPGGALTKTMTISPAGTATENVTHTVVVAGRRSLDAQSYDISIVVGDQSDEIAQKIANVMLSTLGCPFSASVSLGVVTAETLFAGLIADELDIIIDDNGTPGGITYGYAVTQNGSGTPDISASLAEFGNDWNTVVLNSYGTNATVMDALETFNGIPDPESPTGRYTGTIMRPFIALTGSTEDEDTLITDARKQQVTIAICPAPRSKGHSMEAAANMTLLFARKSQDNPHLDVSGQSYPDMPVPADSNIGPMANHVDRDQYIKKGNSTVNLVGGLYEVVDFVTTYHPTGETVPAYRYCRNLMLDYNVRYGYYLLELINVVDHVIAGDNQTVNVSKVVKPKRWKAILSQYADDLALRALIVDSQFMKDSIQVGISEVNPDRFETFFRYKRSGIARVKATTAEAGFNFGN